MANYSLVTISKGEIKTIDSFIKNFNAIGANMKALAVSAYGFLTDENKEVRKDFKTRVLEELNMSNSTLSFLKYTGELYLLNDYFSRFAYTNVYYFKKPVDKLEAKDDAHIEQMFRKIANFSNSRCGEDVDACVNYLVSLSQKELRNVIDKFLASLEVKEELEETAEDTAEETEVVSEDTAEETEEVSEDTSEDAEVEYDDPRIYMYKDDIENTLKILADINGDMTKKDIITEVMKAVELLGNAYDRTQDK